ncbi:MAG: TonB-dependent receptor [Marinilabiliaceae bacterium]|nr:TonB-dependent receptor [Marinilabiliaceae bacterium]
MINKFITIILIFYAFQFEIISQNNSFDIDIKNQSISKTLNQLRDKYDLQLSYNDSELSSYKVSLKGHFQELSNLLQELLAEIPYDFELNNGVYIIYKDDSKIDIPIISTILFNGLIKDSKTGESLPYSTVIINGEYRITDVNGRFSFIAFYEEFLKIEVSHLGYQYYDTTIVARNNFNCELKPVVNFLNEALISGKKKEFGTQLGMSSGQSRMNPKITAYLPGGANIGIKQIIDLQAGVQTASTGYGSHSIWGSYPGHNQIIFDGISIYTYPQMSELIYPVNPFMVKDVIINKGAFGSNFGNRVGGIIMLTGKEGNVSNPEIKIGMDATAINAMISCPAGNRSSVAVAGRTTWFPGYFNYFAKSSQLQSSDKIDTWIPYKSKYYDFNVKYSGNNFNGDQYFISLYSSEAESNNEFISEINKDSHLTETEKRHQVGASVLFNRIWKNGVNTNINFSTSNAEINKEIDSSLVLPGTISYQKIWDNKLSVENRFSMNSKQFVEAGASIQVISPVIDVPLNDTAITSKMDMIQTSAYIRNHIYANKKLLMDIGFRFDYHHDLKQLFVFPRIKGTIQVTSTTQLNFSWGIHQQYLTFVPIIEQNKNCEFIWQGFNKKGNYLLSNIITGGWNFSKNGWGINTEIYQKSVEGLARFRNNTTSYIFEKGRSTTTGADVTVKKELGKHLFLQSYTYNDTKEKYENETYYQPSWYSRLHELKSTALFNLNPVKIGATFVYGSPSKLNSNIISINTNYMRTDLMVSFTSNIGFWKIESGVSAYNIFNQTNESSLYLRNITIDSEKSFLAGQGGMPLFTTFFTVISF